jgi:hypothetical protein
MPDILPPIPDGLSMPFYYASLQTHWLYIPVDADLAKRALVHTGCTPYAFADHGTVAVINFQRYTNTGGSYMGLTSEVEFNILTYPNSARTRVADAMTLAQFAYGEDLEKVIGHFRLHVPATSPIAVTAGRNLFGEPKFVGFFDMMVPSPNNPPPSSPIKSELTDVTFQSPTSWQYSVYGAVATGDAKNPYAQGPMIYKLQIDVAGLDAIISNAPEHVEYGHLDVPAKRAPEDQGYAWTNDHPKAKGALVGGRWALYGAHALYFLKDDTPYAIQFGSAQESPMQIDMRRFVEGRRPVLFQVYDPPPVAAESRAYYVDPR